MAALLLRIIDGAMREKGAAVFCFQTSMNIVAL